MFFFHLLILVMYCLKLTFCSSFQPLFYLVLQRTVFLFKTVCFKYDGCELPHNSVHLGWNPLLTSPVFFSIPVSSFHSLAHNVSHFTGLSCTSSRNVMEMFYLREGYRYLLCVYVYMSSFEGDWYILSFQCPGLKWQLNLVKPTTQLPLLSYHLLLSIFIAAL